MFELIKIHKEKFYFSAAKKERKAKVTIETFLFYNFT